jgi:hypothetical protein
MRVRRSYMYIAWIVPIPALLAMLCLGALVAYGQTGQGKISGTVMDPTGAVVAGATVTATNTDTGLEREAATADAGGYVIPNLPVGQYKLTAKHAGFASETRTSIVLATDQTLSVDFTLKLGDVSQSVEVSASAEMLATTNGVLSQVVNERAIAELPLNGREPSALVNIAPGAISGQQTTVFPAETGCCAWPVATGASVNGGRMSSAVYLLDGGLNMDSYTYVPAPFPNPDATGEFRVATNNYDVRYGNASSAVVNIVTKSGSNVWHGNVFEFLRNDKLNAADFFSHEVDTLKRNQFGGSVGGRIIRDKLFVFGNIQGTIDRTTSFTNSAFVPTDAELNGDFSALLPDVQLINADTGQPYPSNFIDPSTFSPVTLKLEESIPKSTSPDGFVLFPGVPNNNSFREFTTRVDYYPSSKHQVSFRTFYDDYKQAGFDGGGNVLAASSELATRFQSHTGSWTWTVSPNFTNHFVASYSHMKVDSIAAPIGADGKPVCWPCYGTNVADYPQFPPAIIGMYVGGDFGHWGNSNSDPRWNAQLSDSVNWVKGRHLITAGVDIVRQDLTEETDWLARPIVGFAGSVSGSAIADFLQGRADYYQQAGGEQMHVHGNLVGGYVGDTFRLRPNLTLDLGLRWEPFFPPTISHGRATLFRPGMQSRRYPNAPVGLVFPGDPGVPNGLFSNELQNLEPRLGIAWQPKMVPNTSIRAGFGIFVNPNILTDYAHSVDGAPFSPAFQLRPGPGVGPYVDIADPFATVAGTGGVSPFPPYACVSCVPESSVQFALPVTVLGDFRDDYTLAKHLAWNLSIEHQFGTNLLVRAAYIGRESFHEASVWESNPGFFAADGARLLYPNYTSITSYTSWGTASYHAFQATVEKRFSHGLQFTSNYTFSKAIDAGSLSTNAYQGAAGDPFDWRWNRGLSDLNFPNIWSNQWVYQTPGLDRFGRLASAVFGNWEFSGIWQLTSGTPFSIVGGFGNNNSLAQIGGDRADLAGQSLNVHQGSKSQWIQQYFNPAAFQPNAAGTFGNSPRNILAGPGKNNTDLAFTKNVPFKERYRVQFRWEMFNALNRTAFGLPGNDPTGGGYGEIFSTARPARVMQIGLKLHW